MINFFNKSNGGGGDGSSLNIFTQLLEPEIKKGIWLQTDKTPEHYTYDEEVFIGGSWLSNGSVPNLPYSFGNTSPAVTIGTDIYMFNDRLYKFNTLTNTYAQLSSSGRDFSNFGIAGVVGTDIYLFGGNSGFSQAYKYDIASDTYTQLTDVPIYFAYGSGAAVGNYVYLFGDQSTHKQSYKYDTLTDTYTRITDAPFKIYGSGCAVIGTNIYLFGSSIDTRKAYKYDTTNNTYTQLTNIPFDFMYGAAAAVGTDIYLFGGTSNYNPTQNAYKYDTLTNTYTQLTNIPYATNYQASVSVGAKIYLLGGNNSTRVQVYVTQSKTYQQDELVVVSQGKYNNVGYETELYTNTKDVVSPKYAFADAWYYTLQDGLITNIPTYYGNGTNWVKIKN